MKHLLPFLLLPLLSSASFARQARSPVDTESLAQEQCVSSTINITSHTYVDASTSVTLSSATVLEIYNADSSTTINGGYTTSVSTQSTSGSSTNANYGREILPKAAYEIMANWDRMHYYVQSQSVTAATKATVTKCR